MGENKDETVFIEGRSKARAKALLAAAKDAGYEPSVVIARQGGYEVPSGILAGYADPEPGEVAEPIVDEEAQRLEAERSAAEEKAKADAKAKAEQERLDAEAAEQQKQAQEAADAKAAEEKAAADKQAAEDAEAQKVAAAAEVFNQEKGVLGEDPLPEPAGNGKLDEWVAYAAQREKIAGRELDIEEAQNSGRDALRDKYGKPADQA